MSVPSIPMPDWVHALRKRAQRLGTRKQLEELVSSCRERVEHEQWVDVWDVPDLPTFAELAGEKPPRPKTLRLTRPPKKNAECVGFDDQGRVVLVESWNSLDPPEENMGLACHVYEGDRCEIVRYSNRSCTEDPIVGELLYDGPRLVRSRWYRPGPNAATEELCTWDMDVRPPRPMRVEHLSADWSTDGEASLTSHSRSVDEYTYDAEGLVSVKNTLHESYPLGHPAYIRQPGSVASMFTRMPKGVKFKDLDAALEATLVEQAVKQIAARRITDQVYGMLVVYTQEGNVIPPFLALGRERERRDIVARLGKAAYEELWTPADMIREDRIAAIDLDSDPAVRDRCELYQRFLEAKRSNDKGIALCKRIATRLMQHDWSGILDTTDDFIVRADDLDGEADPRRLLKASVPKELAQRLRKAGLV
jgi:hypothetical protein